MLSGCFAFAWMGAGAHALRDSCDWQVIALFRSVLALIFAAGLALAAGEKMVFLRPRSLWLRSISGSISQVCTFFALTRLPISDVLTLTNMFPIWVAVLSWPLLGEAPSGQVWLSVASGVTGVVLIQQPHIAAGNYATVAALAASFFAAFAMIGLHRLRHIGASAVVVHFSAVSSLFCLASLVLFDLPKSAAALRESNVLLLLGAVGLTATVGQLFLTKAFAFGSPARVSVIGLVQVAMAMALDVALFGHSLGPLTLVGIALIVAPTAWLMVRQPTV